MLLLYSSFIRMFNSFWFAGDIRDIEICPLDIMELIPRLEQDLRFINLATFSKFKTRYSVLFGNVSEKKLFALYCYYYCKSIKELMVDRGYTGKKWTKIFLKYWGTVRRNYLDLKLVGSSTYVLAILGEE